MQARTKKHPIEVQFKGVLATMILRGPQEKEKTALRALKELGFKDVSDSIPWREAFSGYSDNQLPGVCLAGARRKEGLTQKKLAEMVGVSQGNISEMECGKRPIGKNMAKRLAKILKVGYKIFL